MKTPSVGAILGIAVLIALVPSCAEEINHQLGTSRRLIKDAVIVGIGFAPKTTPTVAADAAASSAEDGLIEALQRDGQVTVIGEIQLGELLCSNLTEAEDTDMLNITYSPGKAIIAEKTSYTVLDGECFSDGIARKVWNGVEAKDTIEGAHRTVSITWGEECNVEMFLLKITTNYDDGSLLVVKSVPCEAGSSDEICMVEVRLDLNESEEPKTTTMGLQSSDTDRRLREAVSGGRELQTTTTTTIDVMMLYTEDVNIISGDVNNAQVESTLATAITSSNQALINSGIDAEFRLVYVGPLPYDETSTDLEIALENFSNNEAVAQLRACAGADLVQLIGYFDINCGIGYLFSGEPSAGFSVTDANCIDGSTHTHEFGHNLGCDHNRENSLVDDEFAHGWRYCDGNDPYRTVMSYDDGCRVLRVNYFSNPDVILYDKPTGQEDADNARAIELNMAAVADFESSGAAPSICGSPLPAPMPVSSISPTPLAELTTEPAAGPTTAPTISVQPQTKPTAGPTVGSAIAPTISVQPQTGPTAGPTVGSTTAPTISVQPQTEPTAEPAAGPTTAPAISAQPQTEPTAGPTVGSAIAPTISVQPQTEPTAAPTVGSTTGLVDASERTEVTVFANVYDPRNSEEGGCDPDGCAPSNTRDSILNDDSRWSCSKILINEKCRLRYAFDEAQDIVEVNIAFYKGDESARTFKVRTWDISGSRSTSEFTSSGATDGFETFSLGSEETTELVIFPASPDEDDWISILEVEIMV